MITTEKLQEMRKAELTIAQRPFTPVRVAATAKELAEALGELLEYRDAEEQGEQQLEYAPLPANCTLIAGADAIVSVNLRELAGEGRSATMSNVIIKPEHQSAPKAHPADKEIRKAAEEIDAGKWIPDPGDQTRLDNLGLALRLGPQQELRQKPSLEDFQETRTLNELGRHPRVIEAMERMAREVEEAKNPQEQLEKSWMLHEMATLQAKDQKWEGQQRWEGKENEEMRFGQLLTPIQFYDRLAKVTGKGRLKLSTHVMPDAGNPKAGISGIYIKNPRWTGGTAVTEYPQAKAAELKAEAQKTILKARRLRALKLNSEADRTFELAAKMIEEATKVLMEMSASAQLAEPELLRVATLQWPLGTEWMVMNFNEFGVPTTAKYLGWRTALLTMIRCGAITEKQAHKAFPVDSGPAAAWYLEQLMMERSQKGPVQ